VRNGNSSYGGYFFWPQSNGTPITIATANPVALIDQTANNSTVKRLIGTLQVDYAIPFVEGLKANLSTGFDVQQGEGKNINARNAAFASGGPGRREVYSAENISKLFDLYLSYKKNLDRHKIEATGGYSYQNFERGSQSLASNFDGKRFTTYNPVEKPGDTLPLIQPKSLNTLISVFGRVNYNYDDRFLITATLRNDQSSRFSQGTRSGWFPSVAVAWRLSNESFLKDMKQVSNLKLRAGYGITGQQDIPGSYPYLPTYTISTPTAQYQFGNTFYSTLRPNAYVEAIKWESTSTLNAGFDLGLLNDRITLAADYYYRETSDILIRIGVPMGSNLNNTVDTNFGSLVNRGVEVSLNVKEIDKGSFSWNIGTNFTKNLQEITKLQQASDATVVGSLVGGISGGVGNTIQIHSVGYPPFSFYPQQQIYNSAGKPLEGLYVDRNGDGQANEKDWYRYKSPNPEFLVGINSNLTYKKFDFSFSGRLSINNYVYNNVASNRTFYNTIYNANGFFSNVMPDIYNTQFTNAQYRSDYYIENASFFKMDFMSAGYNFENIMGSKLRGRVGLTVRNAFFITKYKGLDPEVANGIDNNIYPRARVYMLNVSLTF
jgi:iron complex outermembrane receptor protein